MKERAASMWDAKYRNELEKRRSAAVAGGGEKRIESQHKKGKLTARERIDFLFDEGSFVEINTLIESQDSRFGMDKKRVPGDGVVIGYGTINGRVVYASAQDFTVIGGTLGEYHSQKICHIMDMALKMKAVITLTHPPIPTTALQRLGMFSPQPRRPAKAAGYQLSVSVASAAAI